ncbi:MAG: DUF1320 domain-containing protein [Desulfuromonadaceae bacterium]|nr:DUF1320 domain-containing protein [Desulfuromonadaceae bacterium]
MYTSLAQIKERMPEHILIALTDDQATGTVGAAVVERAIVDADAEIDSRLSNRYTTPVDPVPTLLQRLSLDLAIEIIYSNRPDVETPEAIVRAAKNARQLLVDIGSKRADLPGQAEATTPTAASGASFSASGRLFSRATLRGM